MKKILFLATVFVAGAATVSIAQLSSDRKEASVELNSVTRINLQDTTKPIKDTVPQKKDSTSFKF